jgi:hypothetical protein
MYFFFDLTIQIYNVESAKETRVDMTIASRDSRPSENQIGGQIRSFGFYPFRLYCKSAILLLLNLLT